MRRDLRTSDFERVAAAGSPPAIFQVMEALTAEVIGHRLFTIMRFDPKHDEVERVYTSMPAVYPIGGRKAKKDTAWSDHVLRDRKVFRATAADRSRAAFDDHATIISLGLGAVLNIPVVRNPMMHHRPDGGWCVGTINLLHEAGWYTERDEEIGVQLRYWLAPALT